jgi:hypothetical protein
MTRRSTALASALALLGAPLAGCLFEVPPLVDEGEDDGGDATDAGSEGEASDGDDETGDTPEDPTGEAPDAGHLAFVLYGEPHLLSAHAGGTLRPLRAELDALAPGVDEPFLQISADGQWLVLSTERFHPDCVGNPCLSVVAIDASHGEALLDPEGAPIRMDGGAAVGDGGTRVVFDAGGGPHAIDLWLVERDGAGGWTAPLLLTSESPHAYHSVPSLDPHAPRVAFDCGPEPYGATGTSICQVGLDGTGFALVWSPDQAPAGTVPGGALHHPSHTPDGGLVFEGSWSGEELWSLPAGAAEPVRIRSDRNNDNSPCVLPDGRVASLWLDRPGGTGVHEIELKSLDGATAEVILPGEDVLDAVMGCGR